MAGELRLGCSGLGTMGVSRLGTRRVPKLSTLQRRRPAGLEAAEAWVTYRSKGLEAASTAGGRRARGRGGIVHGRGRIGRLPWMTAQDGAPMFRAARRQCTRPGQQAVLRAC
jgi:hypothetical protein